MELQLGRIFCLELTVPLAPILAHEDGIRRLSASDHGIILIYVRYGRWIVKMDSPFGRKSNSQNQEVAP